MSKTRMKAAGDLKQTEVERKSEEREAPDKNWTLVEILNDITEDGRHRGLGTNTNYLNKLFWSPSLNTWLYYHPEYAQNIISNLNRRWINGLRNKVERVPETTLQEAGLKLRGTSSFVFLTQASEQLQKEPFLTNPDEFITKFLGLNANKEEINEFRATQYVPCGYIEKEAFAAYKHVKNSTSSWKLIEFLPKPMSVDKVMLPPAPQVLSYSHEVKLATNSTTSVLNILSRKRKQTKTDSTEKKSEAKQETLSAPSQQRKRSKTRLHELHEMCTELCEEMDALSSIDDTKKACKNWGSRLEKTKKRTNKLSEIIEAFEGNDHVIRQCYSSVGTIQDALNRLPESFPKDGKVNDEMQISLKNASEFCEGLHNILNQAIYPKRKYQMNGFFHSVKDEDQPMFHYGIPALDRPVPY